MTRPALILASASPRRADLLASAGVAFEVIPAGIPEVHRAGESPADYVVRNAEAKARAVAERVAPDPRTVLGSDTVVALGDAILEKPDDEAHAKAMLADLSGAIHEVITGVALIGGNGEVDAWSVSTKVVFRTVQAEEIAAYVASGEPMDKAGAYAIQGGAASWVRKIEGSYTNVVGLPLCEVVEALAGMGADRGEREQ